MGKFAVEFITWTILASIVVLIVMNASNVAKVVTSVGGFWAQETSMFTGAGYQKASGASYNSKVA